MKRVVTLVAVVVALLATSACRPTAPGADEARLRVDRASSVTVDLGGRAARAFRGSHLIGSGSIVRVLAGGAVVDLSAGGQIELRRGSAIRIGRPIEVVAGDALVTSGSRAIAVRADRTNLGVTGVARLGRSLAVTAQSYRGVIALESAGRSLMIPALRRTTVPDLGLVAAHAAPIGIEPGSTDAWERRYLGVALDLTPELEARSAGFTGAAADVVQAFPVASSFPLPRRAGDALVGAAVVAAGSRGTVESRWRETFSFRDEGAAWGLVVLDQSLADPYGPARLLQDALTRLFRTASSVGGAPAIGPVAGATSTPSAPSSAAPSGASAVAPESTPTTPASPSPIPPVTPPSVPTPVVPHTGTPLDPILDPVLGAAGSSSKDTTPIVTITTPIVSISVL